VFPLSGFTGKSGVVPLGGTLDLTPIPTDLDGWPVQSFPRDTIITSLAAHCTLSQAQSLVGSTIVLQAQLYTCPAGSGNSTFIAVPGALVTLAPPLTGIVALGTESEGITTGLSIPITAGTRGVLVVSATAAGVGLVNTVPGDWSLGLGMQ
jgi:BclB C-terminal domain-containing protein